MSKRDTDAANAGGIQSQGAEDEAVVNYCESSAMPDLSLNGSKKQKA